MKITIINHSDTRGGAAIASMRLLEALRAQGADASMLVMHKGTESAYVETVQPAWKRKACFLAEHLDIFIHNGFSRSKLFQASTGKWGMPLHRHPWVKDADWVILGWMNQGMLSLSEIAKIKAPVAWIMHDMWNLTGVCHHAGKCAKYLGACDDCRLLKGSDASDRPVHDLSWRTWMAKKELYSSKRILFIAVSTWLAEKCKQSSLMQNQMVEVVPNAFPVEAFSISKRPKAPDAPKTIAFGAARIDDPIKGLALAIEALNALHERGENAHTLFFGAMKSPEALKDLRLPYTHLGMLSPAEIRTAYAQADVVLSASHYETLPTTLIEGMASGCVPVTFGQGGQADIVDHLATGYIAKYPDTADLANGLQWALHAEIEPAKLHKTITDKFSSQAIASKLLSIFQNSKI